MNPRLGFQIDGEGAVEGFLATNESGMILVKRYSRKGRRLRGVDSLVLDESCCSWLPSSRFVPGKCSGEGAIKRRMIGFLQAVILKQISGSSEGNRTISPGDKIESK